MINDVFKLYSDKSTFFIQLLLEHIQLSFIAILIAAIIGFAIGIYCSEHKKIATFILAITNVMYTIPSIALLGMLIPISGIGNNTAIIALSIYGLLPMIRNTCTGLRNIDAKILEAATGMGSTPNQLRYLIKIPLAFPIILSGFRNMVVMIIALSGVASFIGAGGLGVAIYRGITTYNQAMTLAGSILIALFAIICDLILGRLENHIYHKRRMHV